MSDMENMVVMLGGFPPQELGSDNEVRNNEVDLESGRPRQEMIQNSEDFRSLLNTNRSEKKKVTF